MTSASPRLDKRRRTYVRLVGEIHHALNQALNEEKAKRGLNMTKIGQLLGIGRSAVSKQLNGRQNMTLETLADLAYALDRPVKVTLPERTASSGNHAPSPPPPSTGMGQGAIASNRVFGTGSTAQGAVNG